MDLDRLHDVVTGAVSDRGCGKTYAMCVEILQTTEFTDNNILVFCGTEDNSRRIMHTLGFLSDELGYVVFPGTFYKNSFVINNTKIYFIPEFEKSTEPYCIEFFDNYCTDFQYKNKEEYLWG